MAYLVNGTRISSLTINGTDYTNNFISFSCADASAERNGIVTTRGQIVLGYIANGLDISEYRKQLFKRGQVVIINVRRPNGTTFRHPRGYLYVLSTTYNPSDNTNTIEVGCRLSLAELTQNVTNLLGFSSIAIPEERQDFNNLAAYLAADNQILYQDNQGNLIKRTWFESSVTQGDWVSVLDQTILDIAPLGGVSIIPDSVEINYSILDDSDGSSDEDVDFTIVTDSTVTDYEIEFPLKTLIRVPPSNGVAGITGTVATSRSTSNQDDCGATFNPDGNDPTEGRDNDTESCSSNFTLKESVRYISAKNISISITRNTGPAGQTDFVEQSVYGPAIELNTSYFTDKYAYCVQRFQTACVPTGNCTPGGFNLVRQARQLTQNYYDSAGALIRTVVENYKHVLAAAQPTDWRAITVDRETGEETEVFRDGALDALAASDRDFLESLIITDYIYREDNGSKQVTTTYTSTASRGVGIQNISKLDARIGGIKTVETRVSAITSANPDSPDRTNNADLSDADSTNTLELKYEKPIILYGTRFVIPPNETTPYVQQESMAIDTTVLTNTQRRTYVEKYAEYISDWLVGKALGFRVTESLRDNIVTNWYPGRPFFYVDNISGEILLLKADASAWAISAEGAAVTMGGLWVGKSNGTYVVGNNVVG